MKYLLFLIGHILFCCLPCNAQWKLTLDEAVRRSIAHKPSLEVLRLQARQQQLSLKEAKAKWWPELSLAYQYRYNPVIATTIIPIGQFDINNPTNVMRGIKMGTKWQQNSGLTVSQPLIDWAIIRSVKRAKLSAALAVTEQKIGRDELIYETARSYLTVCRNEKQVETALRDTMRTFTTLLQQEALYRNERLLISDLNRARINHNDAINRWESNLTDLVTEKIYLSFLTGIPTDSILANAQFDPQDLDLLGLYVSKETQTDSLHSLRKQEIEQKIAREDLRIAKARNIPTLSFDAFIGANHFNDCFAPFEKGSWYATSYLGISIEIPILYGENISARNKRLLLQGRIHALQESEERQRYQTDAMIASQRIESVSNEIDRLEVNKNLEEEVLSVLGKRFSEQRASAFELNLEELEYLKLQQQLEEKYAELILQSLDYLKNTGLLYLLQYPAQTGE